MAISSNLSSFEAQSAEVISPAGLVVRSLRKHWLMVSIVVGISAVAAWGYTSRQQRIYRAVANLQLDPQPVTAISNITHPRLDYFSNRDYFGTQLQVISSRKVAMLVVRKLNLNRDGAFLRNVRPPAPPPEEPVTVETTAEILRARIEVEPIEESRLVIVRYQDGDPARAQQILSALVDSYVEQNLDTTLAATNKTANWLDTQLVRLKSGLEEEEMELHEFKRKHRLLSVSYDDQSNLLRAEIQQLNASLTSVKARREAVAARLAALERLEGDDPSSVPTSVLLDSGLERLRTQYLDAHRSYQGLLASGKGVNHPAALEAAAVAKTAREALQQEIRNIRQGCAMDLAAVNGELHGLTQLYEAAKQEAVSLNLKGLEYGRLQRSKNNTEKLFGIVLERSTQSDLSKLAPLNNVQVIDRPLLPTEPISPSKGRNMAAGLALGLLLGLAGAMGRDALDRTLRTVEDAERSLGLVALGSLPDAGGNGLAGASYGSYGSGERSSRRKRRPDRSRKKRASGPELLVHSHPKSVAAEAARAIRTNLVFLSPDKPYRCFLVTSAAPGEGKTTVAVSIAIAMAQTGQSVCLVDCDMRKPRVHQIFGEPNAAGVTTALLDPDKLDSLLLESEIPKLSVLRAGPSAPNPADLMHTDAFANLLATLRQRFDRVVIDSPPIGPVTDGVVIATKVDATVLVVRANKTKKDAVAKAVRQIRDVGANMAGFVLNATSGSGGKYYTAYYGEYGASSRESRDSAA